MIWLWLLGCGGLQEDEFREDQAVALCEAQARCREDTDSVTDCSNPFVPPQSELVSCEYVEESGKECLDAYADAECEGSSVAFPPVCGMVLINCTPN